MMGNYHVRFGGRERRVLIEARPSRPNAEISAAYVCASLGIVPTVRHADYIASWLEVLRSDPRAIVQAAGMASRSADWLLGHLPADLAPDGVGGPGEDAPPAIEREAA